MKEITDLTAKLAERRGKAEYDKRQDAMKAAWRHWRNLVIEAMAARVKAAPDKDDEELELLIMELRHTELVAHALQSELGIDADKIYADEENHHE
jgi:hypothetical protein